MQYRDLVYRIHARQSMFTRSIPNECVEHIVHHGEVIEDYPQALSVSVSSKVITKEAVTGVLYMW